MDPTITLSMRIGAATQRRSSVYSASSVAKPCFWISAQSLLNSSIEVFVFLVTCEVRRNRTSPATRAHPHRPREPCHARCSRAVRVANLAGHGNYVAGLRGIYE